MGEVADRIRDYLQSDLRLHRRVTLADDTPLLDGLVDSLQVMRIIAFVEERFEVRLDVAEVTEENFATIATIEALVEGKRG